MEWDEGGGSVDGVEGGMWTKPLALRFLDVLVIDRVPVCSSWLVIRAHHMNGQHNYVRLYSSKFSLDIPINIQNLS